MLLRTAANRRGYRPVSEGARMVVTGHNTTRNAAEMLEGVELDDGWLVTEKIERPLTATGGNFCVGYKVINRDGRHGFLKALDYSSAFRSPDPAKTLQLLTESYNFERDILRACGESRMSRVVTSLADGLTQVENAQIPAVNYIIFESADRDIRAELNELPDLKISTKLQCLHHVATGIGQLHRQLIAHQDLKPSNVLVFSDISHGRISKVSDLGRATAVDRPALHDRLLIAGDPAYAPPEQRYGATPVDFYARRFGCDLYQLGSLTSYVLTGAHINSLISMEMRAEHDSFNWTGTYEEVLPYVRDAFDHALKRLAKEVPLQVSQEVVRLVGYLCNPDPILRGHPRTSPSSKNRYALDRVLTAYDLLAKRARIEERRSFNGRLQQS